MKKINYVPIFAALIFAFIFDQEILIAISALRIPILDIFFKFLSLSGTFIPIPLLIISIIMFYKKTNGKITSLWFAAGTAFIISYAIKYLVGRGRPTIINPLSIEHSPSFPSAHAAVSMAPTPLLSGKIQLIWVGYAVLVALSRVYLGVHYLSDIIAGMLIGYWIGKLFEKYDFFKHFKFLKRLGIE